MADEQSQQDQQSLTPAPARQVREISKQQFLDLAQGAEVQEERPSFRESAAYRLILILLAFTGGLIVLMLVTLWLLVVQDPEHSRQHIDSCIQLFEKVVTILGLPSALALVLGYLFAQQQQGTGGSKRDGS